jgi:ABC-type lipoprotein release transport system permease subunit
VAAVVLALVGLYGVLATVVRQRPAEIGVRMAFGASGRSIFRLVIGQGMRLAALGIAAGCQLSVSHCATVARASRVHPSEFAAPSDRCREARRGQLPSTS